MDKIGTSRIIKIGIVTSDLEKTAAALEGLFNTLPAYDSDKPKADAADYGPEDKYRLYKGQKADDIHMRTKAIYLEPVYFELVQPIGDAGSPWHDHLKKYGTSVCFISFYIEGFKQHIDFMNKQGYPLLFEEEKGFERYAYFDTMEKLGFTLEMKERIPNEPKEK